MKSIPAVWRLILAVVVVLFCTQARAAEAAADKSTPVVSFLSASPPGTYWSAQLPNYPPLPGNPFPELPVYEIDPTNHTFVIDDRSVDYPALWGALAQQAEANSDGDGELTALQENTAGAM